MCGSSLVVRIVSRARVKVACDSHVRTSSAPYRKAKLAPRLEPALNGAEAGGLWREVSAVGYVPLEHVAVRDHRHEQGDEIMRSGTDESR